MCKRSVVGENREVDTYQKMFQVSFEERDQILFIFATNLPINYAQLQIIALTYILPGAKPQQNRATLKQRQHKSYLHRIQLEFARTYQISSTQVFHINNASECQMPTTKALTTQKQLPCVSVESKAMQFH